MPQPILPLLDTVFRQTPALTGLLMTAALLGFALSGLIPEGDPGRTMRRALWLVVAASAVAALAPNFAVLLAARLGVGVGAGLLVAGGLADIARRTEPRRAGRYTGAMIAGTALGGLLSRGAGYSALFLGWRAAFAIGGLATLALVWFALPDQPKLLAFDQKPTAEGGTPPWLVAAGLGILFVNIAVFDLLPYRLEGPPFRLPPYLADLVYLAFIPATLAAGFAGRAVDRLGARSVVIGTVLLGTTCLLTSLHPSVWTAALAAIGSISGAAALHTAHSGAAASHGRVTVGRYLAAYYVGGAVSAPLAAAVYQAGGWTAAILVVTTSWLVVGALALTSPPSRWRPESVRGEPPAAPLPASP